jgi:hypothetical protein
MKDHQNADIGADSNTSGNIVVLKINQAIYDGLEVSELEITASNEATCETETVLIIEWVTPDWAEKPILKMDYPNMGYVVYCESPPP